MSEEDTDRLFEEIEKEIDQEPKKIPVPSSGEHADFDGGLGQADQGRVQSEEETTVSEDQGQKPEEKKPEEDAFEVYDLEEEKTEAAPQVPAEAAAGEAEEEIIELEELPSEPAEQMETIEKSVDAEMADIFGEEAETPAAVAAPTDQAGVETEADDFDLSIFKEDEQGFQDLGALEEVDLTAMAPETSDAVEAGMVPTFDSSGPSRIEAITAPKGPSSMPMTLAVLVAFAALVVTGMLLVAFYYSRLPGS